MATMTSPTPSPGATCSFKSLADIFACGSNASSNTDSSWHSLVAALVVSFASFGGQILGFILLRLQLSRIYQPRSYLVPERDRVPPPPGGIIGWLIPLFTTSNLTLIQKCGLDSYFFLRYLRMLLKIFFAMAVVVMPVLLPINATGGQGGLGLDTISISNIRADRRAGRFWAHTVMAVASILWIFYVMYKELRGYIRVRQAYLTSPQHRIRASATTVLVTGIPRKWLTHEALSGLYDVFPGGIRNIWINRNYDDLATKVSYRHSVAKSLESAETNLIKMCRSKHKEAEEKKAKKEGKAKKGKKETRAEEDAAAEQTAMSPGMSAGAQHDFTDSMQEVIESHQDKEKLEKQRTNNPLGIVEQGIGAVGFGLGKMGKGIGRFGQKVAGDVDTGFQRIGDDFNRAANAANTGGGFTTDDSLFRSPVQGADSDPIAQIAKFSPNTSHARTFQPSPKSPHPFAFSPIDSFNPGRGSTQSERTLRRPSGDTPSSTGTKPKDALQIEVPPSHRSPKNVWKMFQNNDRGLSLPSPEPHLLDGASEYPMHGPATDKEMSKSKWAQNIQFWRKDSSDDDDNDEKAEKDEEYQSAFDKELDEDQDGEPKWRRYIEPKDRETMRLPLFAPTWFPSIPLVGKKVDAIYHLRRELARLNLEIEADQNNVEKYPYMNSAFIQFNHQVAAHMCCQSLSHHVPQAMAPRLVEISPDDVIWDNMSVKWWERYLRTVIVLCIAIGLIIFYAIPVTFTSLLSQINELAASVPWLKWLLKAPGWVRSIISGVLPPLLINLFLMLMPVVFRLLVKQQGVYTGVARELGVQSWYFAFIFIQVFIVVTITGGLFSLFTQLAHNPQGIASTIGTSFPRASNYFFSYLTVQALSSSASSLIQLGSLFGWFILAPLLDNTARAKWRRQTKLNYTRWDTFFPPFTNFAAIGIIYSVLAPLILVFLLFIFGLYWIVYRYNILYVYQFRNDTGGLLFPVAVNQLYVGIYFMEICLIALFFTSVNEDGDIVAYPQAIVMIVMLVLTVIYQILLNRNFDPNLKYLPITLEDEAVIRDEQFARAQSSKFAPLNSDEGMAEDGPDIQDMLKEHEQAETDADKAAEERERQDIEMRKSRQLGVPSAESRRRSSARETSPARWFDRPSSGTAWNTDKWKKVAPEAVARLRYLADGKPIKGSKKGDVEAQNTVGDILFSGFVDELEDLSPEDRDLLVRYAFQHSALRARRPVIWIPRDQLGVSDDEIKRAQRMSTVEVEDSNGRKEKKTYIWMSNDGTALDGKGKVVFRRSPPDFSNVDLIVL